MKNIIVIASMVMVVTSLVAMPMSPELENTLRAEGTFEQVVQILKQAKLNGIDAPNPKPFRGQPGQKVVLKAIAILVDFTDNVAVTPAANFDTMLSTLGVYSTGSMREYFLENSYNNVDLITTVVGWYRMPQTYAYYVDGQYGFGSYPHNAQKMAEDAVWAADPDVDFSQFDNDGDGYIDALFVVHAGQGAEYSGNPNQIWSHAWVTINVPYVDGVYAYHYSTEPEFGYIGVFCHEAGHAVFGCPDLYDYDYDSYGAGMWSLMAFGSWGGDEKRPVHLDGWSKIHAGFVTPQIPTSNQTGVIFPTVAFNPVVYKLWTNGTPGSQFFIVENRQQVGFDGDLPWNGLLIYHVDETQSGNNNQWYPGHTGSGHYLVAVEQADSLWQLEKNINVGNAGDPYPGYYNNRTYNNTSVPDSKDYSFNTTYVAVENISDSDDTMTADISVMPPGIEETIAQANIPALDVFPTLGRTPFTITVGQEHNVRLAIYDVSGRLVTSFESVTGNQVVWHGMTDAGTKAAPGIYFVQAMVPGAIIMEKLIIVR